MKMSGLSGLVCVALAIFALPAAAQTPDGMTPAEEGMCDVLNDATPGLKGLCVAMCEAQDCEAELNPDTGAVEFNPSCNPSSERLLANYNRKKVPEDPRMPCVQVACPCWTEAEMENIAGGVLDQCFVGDTWSQLLGNSTEKGFEMASAEDHFRKGLRCNTSQSNSSIERERSFSSDEYDVYDVCRQSVIDQCIARGLAD